MSERLLETFLNFRFLYDKIQQCWTIRDNGVVLKSTIVHRRPERLNVIGCWHDVTLLETGLIKNVAFIRFLVGGGTFYREC